jgi:ElaA protein
MDLKLNWSFKKFPELNVYELYELLRLRSEVFVVEQSCVFTDMDNKDQLCEHLLGMKGDSLLAYARIVPPGISYAFASIGRIVVSEEGRGEKLGRELLHVSLNRVESVYGQVPIRIGAQLYLKTFYESFGFIQTSDIYPEDGIDHIEMTRDVSGN